MACDICGKTGTTLSDLLDSYQTDDIKQICPSCEKSVNKHHMKLMRMSHNVVAVWLKAFMQERKRQ